MLPPRERYAGPRSAKKQGFGHTNRTKYALDMGFCLGDMNMGRADQTENPGRVSGRGVALIFMPRARFSGLPSKGAQWAPRWSR